MCTPPAEVCCRIFLPATATLRLESTTTWRTLKKFFFFDETHVHRDVDAAVISAGLKYGVPTTIVSPVAIHGVGAGPIKTRSIQIPFLTQTILKRGKAFTVNEGRNLWDSNLRGTYYKRTAS
jgi:hypothetical protein